ncbi:DUF697 domain-containing protein [Hugenholtzia roseola]|uniref:DUF697 domain-containing protein n=1 Tax=Hugenholtzia roseola TaxID=1002 RepID=UPI000412AF94|nr:DUF697 domain-containing protein [Hugenholtzia roseola]
MNCVYRKNTFFTQFLFLMNTTAQEQASEIVQKHVLWSMGSGLIPFPIVDSIAVTVVQLDMLRQISHLYGKEFSENIGKSVISLLTSGFLVRQGASFIKAIPILGSVVGGFSFSILAGASTYAIGQVFVQHFESGGDWLNFDTDKFKNFYKEKFEQGKKVAQDLKDEDQQPKAQAKPQDKAAAAETGSKTETLIIEKLKELHDLHTKGILSEEEYERLKDKVLKGEA